MKSSGMRYSQALPERLQSDELKNVISKSFHELTHRISFAEKWIEKFLNFG